MGIKIKKIYNRQIVDIDYTIKDILKFYRANIQVYEAITNFVEKKLTARELDFLTCCVICVDKGNRKFTSKECVEDFVKIGGFKGLNEVKSYLQKGTIKKWIMIKERNYYLPPFIENITKYNTTFTIHIDIADGFSEKIK